MKAASISEIKSALKQLPATEVTELCLRLARFKKENKELLTYLLFEADNLPAYMASVKEEMDEAFAEVNRNNIYFAKKNLRKILRILNKHIKYTSDKTAEIELRLHFCTSFKGLKLPMQKSAVLTNLYNNQLKKIEATIATLHEDLQHDYEKQLARL